MGLGNIGDLMKMKSAWDKFTRSHPRFPQFLYAVKQKGVPEGTILGVTVEYPNGEKIATNIKVTAEDLDLFDSLSKLGK